MTFREEKGQLMALRGAPLRTPADCVARVLPRRDRGENHEK